MRLLLISLSYPPETNSAGVLFGQLAEGLASRGHQVTVITRFPRAYLPEGIKGPGGRLCSSSIEGGVRVLRVATLPLPRKVPLLRGIEQFTAAMAILVRGVFSGRNDVALIYSPPLPFAVTGALLERLRGTPFILNIQDLYPQTPIDLGLMRNPLLVRFSKWLERFAYRRAGSITVHSEDNLRHVASISPEGKQVTSIPNWVDMDALTPGEKDNQFRIAHAGNARVVVSFAGVMGFAQGLETVVQAAERLSGRTDIKFLLVGEGVMRPRLESMVVERNLSNVSFLPLQPPDKYSELLAASDICLVPLNRDLKTPVVPAKLQSIMAAGRPVAASVGTTTGVPKIVEDSGCGLVSDPADSGALAAIIEQLADDPEQRATMGRAGREFAESHYSLEAALDGYVAELDKIARS